MGQVVVNESAPVLVGNYCGMRNNLLTNIGAGMMRNAIFSVAILSLFTVIFAMPGRALAVPSFAQQTGQPCSACHVGAFGPQLKPYGRDFKLFGYQSSDDKSHVPPIAAMLMTSLTHTDKDQSPPPAPNFGPNDNVALDQISLFYAGKLGAGFGAFVQGTYDGVGRVFNLDNFDVRRAKEFKLFGKDAVGAIDINNNPTVEDPWNTTPAWGFPYSASAVAPGPSAATLVDGGLEHLVVGTGAYVLWDQHVYVDAAAYVPLARHVAGWLGEGVDDTSDRYRGVIPYGRIAYVHDRDNAESQTWEVGAYGIRARRNPGGDSSQGADTFSDWGVDGTYQYIGDGTHVVSAHATYIHEDQDLMASAVLFGTNRRNTLKTARADVSYSYKNTWTPSVQVFTTQGSNDPAFYGSGVRTTGYILELAYIPFGKPDSPIYWANTRLAVQYVGYRKFNGEKRGATANNTLFLNLWVALAPFGSMVHR